MRRAVFALSCSTALVGGCGHLALQTKSRLALDTPVQANVSLAIPPAGHAEPVVEMSLDGGVACGKGPKVALVDVDGLLVEQNLNGPYSRGENPLSIFCQKVRAAAADPDVTALVLRVNSPGGTVTATDLMWHELRDFRARTGRPVVAWLLGRGTGGAYYLATAADRIVATPTALTGGVGVVWNGYNLRDLMAQQNILPQSIKSGANIDMGSVLGPLTPEARRLLQGMADDYHERFKAVVRECRPALRDAPATAFDGRVFTARQALDAGLIDRVGYLEDVVAAVRECGGPSGARLVVFHRPGDPVHSPYDVTPNTPAMQSVLPLSIPGLERSRLPAFLYLWQPDPTLERLGGY